MNKTTLALLFTGLISSSSMADTLAGVYVGGQVWSNESSGEFGSSRTQADFNLKDEEQGSYFIAVEHPLPFIPNIKLSSTTLDTSGSAVVNGFELGGGNNSFTGNVDTVFDISYLDYTLYYEIFDNDLLSVDVGITARDFDGDISVTDGSNTDRLSISEYVPMLYASMNIGLPFTGFNLYAEGAFLSFDDNTVHDYQAGISYELIDNLVVDLNILVGYRSISLELEDLGDLYSDLEFEGVYAGAVLHF